MAAIRGYIAASLDGFIADENGAVDWLTPFQDAESDFHGFIAQIDTVVMGRGTYEAVRGFGIGWPYQGKPGIVVTSSEPELYDGVVAWRDGLNALVTYLRGLPGDVWVVGGGRLQGAFIEARALDRLEFFLAPVLLGAGVPLFPGITSPSAITPRAAKRLSNGLVYIDYRLG